MEYVIGTKQKSPKAQDIKLDKKDVLFVTGF